MYWYVSTLRIEWATVQHTACHALGWCNRNRLIGMSRNSGARNATHGMRIACCCQSMRQQQAHLARRLQQLVFWCFGEKPLGYRMCSGEMSEYVMHGVVRYWQLFEINFFIIYFSKIYYFYCVWSFYFTSIIYFVDFFAKRNLLLQLVKINDIYLCAFLALLTILNAHLFEFFTSSFFWWLIVCEHLI